MSYSKLFIESLVLSEKVYNGNQINKAMTASTTVGTALSLGGAAYKTAGKLWDVYDRQITNIENKIESTSDLNIKRALKVELEVIRRRKKLMFGNARTKKSAQRKNALIAGSVGAGLGYGRSKGLEYSSKQSIYAANPKFTKSQVDEILKKQRENMKVDTTKMTRDVKDGISNLYHTYKNRV